MSTAKYATIILSILVATLSTLLTTNLMYEISNTSNLMGVFVALGFALEGSKILMPVLAANAHKQGQTIKAVMYGSVTVLLVAISFMATVATIETNSNNLVQVSKEYQQLNRQIEALQVQADDTRERAYALPSNYITKRGELIAKADRTDTRVLELITKQGQVKPASFLITYSVEVSLVVASVLEVLSLLLFPLLLASYPPSLAAKLNVRKDSQSVIKSVPIKPVALVSPTKDTLIEDIKKAVIAKEIKPSCRGVRTKFNGLGNDAISAVLKELATEGVLVPRSDGNMGWEYA